MQISNNITEEKIKNLWILYPAALVPGMVMVLPGSSLPSIMEAFSLDKIQAGYIGSAFFAGTLAATLMVSDLVRKLGARGTLLIASAIIVISLSSLRFVLDYHLLLFMFLLIGASFGLLVTMPGVVISGAMGESSGGAMNFIYAFFALGVMFAPFASGWMLGRGCRWWAPYLLPVGPAALVAALSLIYGLPAIKAPAGLSMKLFRELRRHRGVFLGGTMCVLFYVAGEATLCFWLPKFLIDSFPIEINMERASRALSWFWAGLTVGRIAAGPILKRIDPAIFLIAISSLGSVVIAASPHLGSASAIAGGFALSGLCCAAMYPTIVSYSGKLGPELAPAAFSLMTAAGQIGAMILPPTVGYASTVMPFKWSMSLTALPILALAVLAYYLHRKRIF